MIVLTAARSYALRFAAQYAGTGLLELEPTHGASSMDPPKVTFLVLATVGDRRFCQIRFLWRNL
jgi:hypothetical protein